jgi:hypothetical protein
MSGDPVVKGEDGFWYFWNEVWTDAYGPYFTEEEARQKLREYIRDVLGD